MLRLQNSEGQQPLQTASLLNIALQVGFYDICAFILGQVIAVYLFTQKTLFLVFCYKLPEEERGSVKMRGEGC